MLGLIVRFVVSAVVLMLVSFLLPGFATLSFWQALIAAVVIAILGYLVESLFGRKVSPQNRGLVGFDRGRVILAQFLVPGMSVSHRCGPGGGGYPIDLFIPTELR